MRQRFSYWSCSKFADILRGEKKPMALSMEDWNKWKINQKSNNKFRYFLSDILLNKIQNILYYPSDLFNSIRIYIKNRFITKTHYLKTGLRPGFYHELDERILHGLFNELVEFVEIEQAWIQYISSFIPQKTKKDNIDDVKQIRKYLFAKSKIKKFTRSPELGIKYLNWAMNLVFDETYGVEKEDPEYGQPTEQAIAAKEILELYLWWKKRDERKNPYGSWGKKDIEAIKKSWEIEEQYDKEDEDMLIRLIKVRKNLWT